MRTRGIRVRGRLIELRVLDKSAANRVGVIVPKHSNTAVARNKVKRRLREIVRSVWPRTRSGIEVLVFALPSAYRATFEGLQAELVALWPVAQAER